MVSVGDAGDLLRSGSDARAVEAVVHHPRKASHVVVDEVVMRDHWVAHHRRCLLTFVDALLTEVARARERWLRHNVIVIHELVFDEAEGLLGPTL